MAYRTFDRRDAAMLLAAFGVQACAAGTALPAGLALAGALLALVLCVRLAHRTHARKLGQYILGAQIGAGNMGAVYSARHATRGHRVAIKVLHAERISARDRARFAREVELTRRLAHAHTVSILDSGIGPDDAPYFAMEYIEGVDLQTLVEREGPLPAARAIGILSQVSAALSCAHAQGIVHRDIKPANIVVAARGAEDHVKLVDFGLAQIQSEAETLNDADTISGTPLYLAPEAITAADAIDPRADLYALGAVGYFLLTGQHVFGGRSVIELCSKHLYEVPVAPSQRSSARAIPEALEAIVLACLAKSPSARPASAAALQSALLACSERASSDDAVQRAVNVELAADAHCA